MIELFIVQGFVTLEMFIVQGFVTLEMFIDMFENWGILFHFIQLLCGRLKFSSDGGFLWWWLSSLYTF